MYEGNSVTNLRLMVNQALIQTKHYKYNFKLLFSIIAFQIKAIVIRFCINTAAWDWSYPVRTSWRSSSLSKRAMQNKRCRMLTSDVVFCTIMIGFSTRLNASKNFCDDSNGIPLIIPQIWLPATFIFSCIWESGTCHSALIMMKICM